MKKINNIFTLLVTALMGLSLTACSSDDLDTNQYQSGVSLNAFGPSPVMRGGQLRFIGSNLDQIREVRIPGVDAITAIEVVKSGVPSEIRVTVPHDGPETGHVVLVANNDKEITTASTLTYIEGIAIKSFTPSAMPGDVIEIVGDEDGYLNLVHSMAFADNVIVSENDFIQHDRYTIKVRVPEEAKTGKLQFFTADLTVGEASKLDYQIVTTEERLIVGIPTVTKVKGREEAAVGGGITAKAGETITVTGSYLQLVETVVVGGVETTEFSTDGTSLSFALPAKASDGEISLVCKSGVEIPVGSITTVIPSELAAAPAPVKNGAEITVTGKDIDLITGISFPNAGNADAQLKVTADKVTAIVPEAAQEGDITLSLANGKTVTVAYTLVVPTVTACAPAELTAGDGVTVKGTDLDLVKSVTFPGDEPQTVESFSAQSASEISLTVPTASAGTGFTLNLKNGTAVEISGTLTIKAATAPAISSIDPSEACAGEKITIKGKNLQNVQTLYIGSYKVTRYTSRSNTEIVCTVPATAEVGSYKVIIEDFDGEKTEAYDFKVVPAERDVAAVTSNMDGSAITYPYTFTWGDDGRFRLMKADLNAWGVKKGSKLIFYKEQGATGQVQIDNANWGGIYTVADWNGTESKVEQVFDDAMMEALTVSDGWSDTAFILQGDLKNVTKICVVP